MSGQPETVANQLIDEINAAKQRSNISDIEFASWKKQANALINVDPLCGHVALGIVAALKGDTNSLIKNHEIALRYDPSNWYTNYNYAVSLKNAGLLEKSITHAEKAYKYALSKEEIYSSYETLLNSYMRCFQFCKANELAQKTKEKDLQEREVFTPELIKNVEAACDFMQAEGISDSDLSSFARCAQESTEAFKHGTEYRLSIPENGVENQLLVQLIADCSAEEISDISWAVAENLASRDIPAYVNDRVVLSCWQPH